MAADRSEPVGLRASDWVKNKRGRCVISNCSRTSRSGPSTCRGTLWLNLGRLIGYLESNDRYLVNYRRRHYKGLPISSSIAESAVNEVVSWRMAKKRQMRWSDEGAHPLAQVRVHVINGDLYPRAFATPLRPPKPFHRSNDDAYFELKAA